MNSHIYGELNSHWKAVCRVIFGQEVGEFRDFEPWLAQGARPLFKAKSSLSGKEVSFILPHSPANARAVSLSEIDFAKGFEPLNVNRIKDLDSIVEALGERLCYTGDIYLGNSKFIESSTDVIESFYLSGCAQAFHSKYAAYCGHFEYGESIFGSICTAGSKFCIRIASSDYALRCFEISNGKQNSDCMYSHGLRGCSNCLFSFHLRDARYRIGNLLLSPEKYASLRNKLVSEMAEQLRKEKRLPTLFELAGPAGPGAFQNQLSRLLSPSAPESGDKEVIERDFQETTRLIFGKSLQGIDGYGAWLGRNTRGTRLSKSAATGFDVILPDHGHAFSLPQGRVVSEAEASQLGGILHFSDKEAGEISFSGIAEPLGRIAFFCAEENKGNISNSLDSHVTIDSANVYRNILAFISKNCAFNYYALESRSVYGCNTIRKSMFAVKCFLSANISRCFEVDSSRDCSDALFCHNCENVHCALFSFNVKNKRNLVGNTELPKQKYLELKGTLVSQMLEEIEENKGLERSILNLAGLPS